MTFQEDRAELTNWIDQHCPEFADVPGDVKAAAFYFIMLWSVFDRRHLQRSGSRAQVEEFCQGLPENVEFAPFQTYWDYYQGRFANLNDADGNFADLIGDDYQTSQVIEPIIESQQGPPREKLIALIWITYRLRCNLVHGAKHEKGIGDQYGNLMMGAKLMTTIMSLYQ